MPTDLQDAIREYAQRSQFHDQTRLEAVIAAVRAEEREKFRALVAAARVVVDSI